MGTEQHTSMFEDCFFFENAFIFSIVSDAKACVDSPINASCLCLYTRGTYMLSCSTLVQIVRAYYLVFNALLLCICPRSMYTLQDYIYVLFCCIYAQVVFINYSI